MYNTYKIYGTGRVIILVNFKPSFMEIISSKYTTEGHK